MSFPAQLRTSAQLAAGALVLLFGFACSSPCVQCERQSRLAAECMELNLNFTWDQLGASSREDYVESCSADFESRQADGSLDQDSFDDSCKNYDLTPEPSEINCSELFGTDIVPTGSADGDPTD